jgi:hypothetical protein
LNDRIKRPFGHTRLAQCVSKRLEALASTKSQREIASEVGYHRPNIISMIKTGDMKMPLDKVPLFAKALGVDVAMLMRLAMEQHWDSESVNGFVPRMFINVLSNDEMALIDALRALEETDRFTSPTSNRRGCNA